MAIPLVPLCLGDLPQEFLLSASMIFLGLNLHLVWGFASETFKPLRRNLEFGEYTAANMEKYQLHFIQPTANVDKTIQSCIGTSDVLQYE